MNEETENPEEHPTEDVFRKLSSADTWMSNGNGAAPAHRNGTNRVRLQEVKPECGRCNDSLWVLASSSDSDVLSVVPCDCQSESRDTDSRLRTYSQLGHLERMTFDALVPEGRRGRADESLFSVAVKAARRFAEDPEGWLVIEGATGSGKTHLAAAIVNTIIERGSPVKYISALDLPDLIRDERFDEAEITTSFASMLEAPVLVIDDLGAQRATNWVDAKLDQLLTHRFNGRLPTIIVLAKSIDELPERIAFKLDDPEMSGVFRLSRLGVQGQSNHLGIARRNLERMTFETFVKTGASSATHDEQASISMAWDHARAIAEEEHPDRWLYVHGPTGVGKTHLAVSIANVRLQRGDPVVFWSVSDLLDRLRLTYSDPDDAAFFKLFDAVRSCEFLILDDFGQQNMTDWTLEKLYQLIAHRHDRILPTVITSQYIVWDGAGNEGWERVRSRLQWESIHSRLNDQSVVTEKLIAGPDYRGRGR